jgi:hypothetical protein
MQALSQLSYGPVKCKILYLKAKLNTAETATHGCAAGRLCGARRIPELFQRGARLIADQMVLDAMFENELSVPDESTAVTVK